MSHIFAPPTRIPLSPEQPVERFDNESDLVTFRGGFFRTIPGLPESAVDGTVFDTPAT